jgi:glucan phosphoethanolaminetransferase (alkaline phosphatase superfamily)
MLRQVLLWLSLIFLLIAPVLLIQCIDRDVDLWEVIVTVFTFGFPVVFFYRNLKLYLYMLTGLVFVTPLFLFSLYLFRLRPGIELVAVLVQTNVREATEAIGSYVFPFCVFVLVYIFAYVKVVTKITAKQVPFVSASLISVCSFFAVYGFVYYEKQLFTKPITHLRANDVIETYHYPLSLFSALNDVRILLKKNNLDRAASFSFQAQQDPLIGARQIHVLIIGESSRYHNWQINGYHRETSPRLMKRKNLLVFNNAVAGGHYTWVAVPQLITRATPDDYDLQYREKSILGAFSEINFKTVWISNQTDQEIFWTGSIVLHAKTADYSFFSPSYSPNFEFENFYDERVLPIADSIMSNTSANLFLVIHTMGNHWDYSQRYPTKFDHFKPSGKTTPISPPDVSNKEAIINSYDNSVRYADFIIDNVVSMVDKQKAISTVTFVSDHGDDLFDREPNKINFHLYPGEATLHVPLFMWASEEYIANFADKYEMLKSNTNKSVGAENIFHTLLDVASISSPVLAVEKSLARKEFTPSLQKFYNDDKQAVTFSSLQH